jgi:HlyD family secretion protein
MNALKPWAWPIGLGVLLLAGLIFALWPRAIAVDLVTLNEGPMAVAIEDDGVTRVREVYVVSAPIAGRMLRVEAHAGDSIEAQKTVIATIEPADPAFRDARAQRELEFTVSAARAAQDLAAANVRGREADLKLSRQERERTRQLFAKGIVAKARLDNAEAAVVSLEAALATAQAAFRQRAFEVKTAEASLVVPSDGGRTKGDKHCCFTIRAPIDGQILRVMQENEAVVQMGTPLVEVGDPANLEIVVDLLSTEAVKVSEGDRVLITRWGGEGALNGRVRRVEPFGFMKVSSLGIEEQRVNVIIDLTDPHDRWRRLGHGYQIDAAIVRWQSDKALQVPIGALFRQGADWAVFRVDGGRARVTKVKVDHMNDRTAQVLEGLKPGDQVVSHPGERVADGAAVVGR